MVVTRKLLEADVQKACVDWARARGYWARKFSSQSQRSVPDYLFASDGWHKQHPRLRVTGKIKFATEFKRPGAKRDPLTGLQSTEAQIDEQELMRLAGWFVFECDNFDKFKATVIAYEKECV